MPDWQDDARRAARRAGVDPRLFVALVRQESQGNPNAVSPAGAIGYSQLMPATARGLGVDPRDPQQNLRGGATYLAQQLKAFGGDVKKALAAYNAGPGAVQRYGGIPPFKETQAYVQKVLGYMGDGTPNGRVRPLRPEAPQRGAGGTSVTVIPGQQMTDFGPAQNGAALLAQAMSAPQQRVPVGSSLPAPAFAAKPVMGGAVPMGGGAPAPKADIGGLIDAARTQGAAPPGTTSGLIVEASTPGGASGGGPGPRGGSGGAQAALGWAESKIGFRETGDNSGGLASYLNERFGFRNAPWCAMFTSAAVTKGGAPKEARSASVPEIRAKAMAGQGYQKGLVDPKRAKAGDLILWGGDHIAMVQRVKNGRVYYVGGNQSQGVTEASVPLGNGDIVRPRYGAR